MTLYPMENRGGGDSAPSSVVAAGLWAIRTNGAGKRELVEGTFGAAAWSPDGKEIAYIAQSGDMAIPAYLDTIPAQGGTPTVIARLPDGIASTDVETLSWSPDSKNVLLSFWIGTHQGTESGIDTVTLVGGAVHTLIPPSTTTGFIGASYSPDGTQVAVLSTAQEVIPTAPPSGTSPTTSAASSQPSGRSTTLAVGSADGSNLKAVSRLPDGSQLIGWF